MKKVTDPIAQLMQEHNEALVQLKLLNKAVNAFRQDGFSARHFRQIQASLRFIEEEVSVHNHKEESALFPVLERYVEGPTRIMRNDHKQLRRGFVRLSDAIGNVERNRDSFKAIRTLSTIAQNVVLLFVNHIHKENYILFPLVQKFLTKDELREIAKMML
ncbi:MAG: hemerythrin domain-containing protein [Ignavibacteriae bacterium]|nr:hemerythrin domain-containing protein [Ignavibacteria bacterium]MBI3365542.1 hemerythrin domain-containing protein [Ignavibacteriota bacterium]